MKYPEQFFYDLYGKNIKYTMTIFMFIVAMILAYLFYESSKYEDFLKSKINEIIIFKAYYHRGGIFINKKYYIEETCDGKVCMYDKLIKGSILRKTNNKDSVAVIDKNGESYKFNVNKQDGW